ncbi:MAG: 3-phosphoshikimate 1-carboxyvinyltransferase [Peptococcaceae bacterium]|jgi:3-phosphoshikimate 1-carboxyvinyltransferase|nr:3-phosphoshikimate 1-carboxyvinyltransferase [Peptococcaceae bacterium]
MEIRLNPGKLKGRIVIQSSKSQLHRTLICAALSAGISEIGNVCESLDVLATLDGLVSLGLAEARRKEGAGLEIRGKGRRGEIRAGVDCGESGTTLRFLIPLVLAKGGRAVFRGGDRLMDRPMGPYEEIFRPMGIVFARSPEGIQVEGRLAPRRYELAGNVSSQFISGLLLALPLLEGDSQIALLTPLESRDYVEMTLDAMRVFGVRAYWENDRLLAVPGKQSYRPVKMDMEGDWSHAAFFLAAGALGGDVTCLGLNLDSAHGDKAILPLLEAMGASVQIRPHEVRVMGGRLRGVDMDVSQIPDLAPVLAVLGCGCEGTARIYNAGRLRMKESDRLSAMSRELRALGADVEEGPDWMEIRGNPEAGLTGGRCRSHNDHRVAMSLAVASALCREAVTVAEAESVAKSSPSFWEDIRKLGGGINDGTGS